VCVWVWHNITEDNAHHRITVSRLIEEAGIWLHTTVSVVTSPSSQEARGDALLTLAQGGKLFSILLSRSGMNLRLCVLPHVEENWSHIRTLQKKNSLVLILLVTLSSFPENNWFG
jgi:hypothetical protein